MTGDKQTSAGIDPRRRRINLFTVDARLKALLFCVRPLQAGGREPIRSLGTKLIFAGSSGAGYHTASVLSSYLTCHPWCVLGGRAAVPGAPVVEIRAPLATPSPRLYNSTVIVFSG